MPDPLGYARGAMDELRARYGSLSQEELLELVCSLTKEYVLDQTIPFDFPHPERADAMRGDRPDAPPDEDDTTEPSEVRFARLISGLKARTELPQFDDFQVEDGKAVLVVDNQKVVFGERVTVSLFSRQGRSADAQRGASPAPAPTPRTGAATPAPRTSRPAQAAQPAPFANRGAAPPAPSRTLSLDDEPARQPDTDVDFDDSGVERFGGLDLD
ncbi:MAG: hypothetical protein JKY65_19990 [Planctomycetes bacterium]|nr:hypothetical protein [Planctomycetota bacterium]